MHHKKLIGDLKQADIERREQEVAAKQKEQKAKEELIALNRTHSENIMQQQRSSELPDDLECKEVFSISVTPMCGIDILSKDSINAI